MARTYHHGRRNKDKYGLWDNWSQNEPKYWRKMFKHKKQRAGARRCEKKVMQGYEGVIWPHNKKPWIYYW